MPIQGITQGYMTWNFKHLQLSFGICKQCSLSVKMQVLFKETRNMWVFNNWVYPRYSKMQSQKINRTRKQGVDNWRTWIRYATCRSLRKSTIPSLKWMWCMVAEKSATKTTGYGRKTDITKQYTPSSSKRGCKNIRLCSVKGSIYL